MILAVCESFHAVTFSTSRIPADFYVLAMIIATMTFPSTPYGVWVLSQHHSLGQRLHQHLPCIGSGPCYCGNRGLLEVFFL